MVYFDFWFLWGWATIGNYWLQWSPICERVEGGEAGWLEKALHQSQNAPSVKISEQSKIKKF